MRRTEILARPRVPPCASSLCRLLRALLLEVGASRRYLRESFLGCLDPYQMQQAPGLRRTSPFLWTVAIEIRGAAVSFGSIADSASVFFAVSQCGQVSWWRGGRILEVLDEILLETTPENEGIVVVPQLDPEGIDPYLWPRRYGSRGQRQVTRDPRRCPRVSDLRRPGL